VLDILNIYQRLHLQWFGNQSSLSQLRCRHHIILTAHLRGSFPRLRPRYPAPPNRLPLAGSTVTIMAK